MEIESPHNEVQNQHYSTASGPWGPRVAWQDLDRSAEQHVIEHWLALLGD